MSASREPTTRFVCLGLLLTLVLVSPASAGRLEELEARLKVMQEQQDRMQKEQQRLLQEIERLKLERSAAQERQRGEVRTQTAAPSHLDPETVVGGQAPPAKETLSLERLLVTRGNILLRQAEIEVETSVQYAHFASQRLSVSGFAILPSLVIGQISTQRIQRDVVIPALTIRGGIFDWLQGDVVIPYRWEHDRFTDSLSTTEATVQNHGIGDVEGGLAAQILRERGWVPDFIVSLRYKSRTGEDPFEVAQEGHIGGTAVTAPALGTGFETYRPGFTLVKSSDPAILFAGFGVLLSPSREVTLLDGSQARIAPGNAYEFNLGIAFALNPDFSLNFQYIQRFTEHTRFNDIDLSGSALNVGTANVGATMALTRRLALDFSLGIGLTEDAPDVTAQIRLPYRFSLK